MGTSAATAACCCYQADRVLKLCEAMVSALDDPRRRQASCQHDALSSGSPTYLRTGATGYEDLNDHHTLRRDLALQRQLIAR